MENRNKKVIGLALEQIIAEKKIHRDSIWFNLEMEKSLFDGILSEEKDASVKQLKEICSHIGITFSTLLERASELVVVDDKHSEFIKYSLKQLAEIDRLMNDDDSDDGEEDPDPTIPDPRMAIV